MKSKRRFKRFTTQRGYYQYRDKKTGRFAKKVSWQRSISGYKRRIYEKEIAVKRYKYGVFEGEPLTEGEYKFIQEYPEIRFDPQTEYNLDKFLKKEMKGIESRPNTLEIYSSKTKKYYTKNFKFSEKMKEKNVRKIVKNLIGRVSEVQDTKGKIRIKVKEWKGKGRLFRGKPK